MMADLVWWWSWWIGGGGSRCGGGGGGSCSGCGGHCGEIGVIVCGVGV